MTTTLSAQSQTAERTADLQDEGYSITGQAFLRAFDDGSLQLVLSDDFDTQAGPDVRIYLNNTIDLNGAIEIVNLSDLDHFSGAITLDVPGGIEINDYNFIVFYCVAFNALWASGDFGEPADTGNDNVCIDHATATTNWVTQVAICPDDGVADSLELRNSIGGQVGENYAYLLTDTNQMVLEVIQDTVYDFEGTGPALLRVYGISYTGDLNPAIGANRLQTTASICHTHSSADLFLTVTKDGCPGYECRESLTATFGWVTEVNNCSTDGEADEILLQNNIMTPPGENYAFLLTDTNQMLLEVVMDSIYNFEGAGTEDIRVYGMSYDGTMSPAIGQHRSQTTAENCYIHSGDNLFLTVRQTAACPSSIVNQELSKSLLLYPVPAEDELNLQLPEGAEARKLEILDALGRTIYVETLPNWADKKRIDLNAFQAGNYTVLVYTKTGIAAKPFLVSR